MKERVIQFGEGGFLRSFVDVFIHKMNEQGLFGGKFGSFWDSSWTYFYHAFGRIFQKAMSDFEVKSHFYKRMGNPMG